MWTSYTQSLVQRWSSTEPMLSPNYFLLVIDNNKLLSFTANDRSCKSCSVVLSLFDKMGRQMGECLFIDACSCAAL